MLSCLSLDQRRTDHVGMFSKGLLVALTQILPCCTVSQWSRLLGALRELIASQRLHVPFSLEYVDYLPLLDLKRFSCELRLSVLLLRVLQLLCGSSCSHWLPAGWLHVGRLYSHAVREMMSSLRAKLPPKASCASNAPQMSEEALKESVPSQEVLFVLSQLFCHVQHIQVGVLLDLLDSNFQKTNPRQDLSKLFFQVMMPGGRSEPLFLSSLDILSHYEAVMAAFPDSSSPLESDNTRHFFSTITDNLDNEEMKAVLQQKIAQLVSSAA